MTSLKSPRWSLRKKAQEELYVLRLATCKVDKVAESRFRI